jgi:hypothetical protein
MSRLPDCSNLRRGALSKSCTDIDADIDTRQLDHDTLGVIAEHLPQEDVAINECVIATKLYVNISIPDVTWYDLLVTQRVAETTLDVGYWGPLASYTMHDPGPIMQNNTEFQHMFKDPKTQPEGNYGYALAHAAEALETFSSQQEAVWDVSRGLSDCSQYMSIYTRHRDSSIHTFYRDLYFTSSRVLPRERHGEVNGFRSRFVCSLHEEVAAETRARWEEEYRETRSIGSPSPRFFDGFDVTEKRLINSLSEFQVNGKRYTLRPMLQTARRGNSLQPPGAPIQSQYTAWKNRNRAYTMADGATRLSLWVMGEKVEERENTLLDDDGRPSWLMRRLFNPLEFRDQDERERDDRHYEFGNAMNAWSRHDTNESDDEDL